MTLGILVPLLAAIGSLIAVPLLLRQLRALPGPTEAGHEPAQVASRARGLRIVIAAELAMPVLLYLVLNLASDLGTLELL